MFDNPTMLQNTPKYFKHERRDKSATIQSDHCCGTITSKTKIPKRWKENLLHCRECKRSLVTYLTHYLLHNMKKSLQHNHTLFLAGGFDNPIAETYWYVQYNTKPQPDPRYNSNAEETGHQNVGAREANSMYTNTCPFSRHRYLSHRATTKQRI